MRSYVYDDETGLYYLQSRYYDPEIGRFINADVFTSTGQGLLGNNMFAYCNNNPVNYVDPSGHCRSCILGTMKSEFSYASICDMGGGGGFGGAIITFDLLKYLTEAAESLENQIREKLSQSLAKATNQKQYKTQYEEHHIAAKKSPFAKEAADILNEVLPGGVEDSMNKVMLKTSVHRRIHTYLYYGFVNSVIIFAYESAGNRQSQQYENVVNALGFLRIFLLSLNEMSIN